MELLAELAALQRENADRLSRVERCLSFVTAALPALAADGRPEPLTGEDRRSLLEDAADVLDDVYDGPRPRRHLDS
jgi:hypothetical protein